MFKLRALLPSQVTPDEVDTLSTLRVIYDDCDSDLTLTLKDLYNGAAALDAKVRITLAEVDDQIVGWGTVEKYYRRGGHYTVLLNVYVHPTYRCQGIGSALANAVEGQRTQITDQAPSFEHDQEAAPFYRRALPQYFMGG